jgi:hypothetical protein
MADLHMSQELGILMISLFVAGYCVGKHSFIDDY